MVRSELKIERKISVAHFVQTAKESDNYRIHGHDWKFLIHLFGDIKRDGRILTEEEVDEMMNQLDQHLLIPNETDSISVVRDKNTAVIHVNGEKRYSIPANEVVKLDVPAVTPEFMAALVCRTILRTEECEIDEVSVDVKEKETTATVGYTQEEIEG